eukprot:12424946-Karenia_brevis.AAC.1
MVRVVKVVKVEKVLKVVKVVRMVKGVKGGRWWEVVQVLMVVKLDFRPQDHAFGRQKSRFSTPTSCFRTSRA